MTTDDLIRSLHLSDDQVRALRLLTAELKAFDAKIKAESPLAQRLAVPSFQKDSADCINVIASLLNTGYQEAENLIDDLLDGKGQLTGFSRTSIMGVSQLVQRNPLKK